MNSFIALTENDKRLLISIFLILIILFVIVGYLTVLIKKIMNHQGKKADDFLFDVIDTGAIKSPLKLYMYGQKKNYHLLFKQAWLPFLIMIVSSLVLIIYMGAFDKWDMNIFGYEKDSGGFSTILFLWDFANAPKSEFFGVMLISDWPPLLNTPHFDAVSIPSYIFVFGMVIGGIWYLIAVQSFISRQIRIVKARSALNKTLEGYNIANSKYINQENTPVTNNPESISNENEEINS